ncbi:MAG: CDP-2,3-bis-(O-geranylgeranyl)-sn-glycerol synthase [Candidatus Poseidoniia archaeon]|nr:CDP-2,3-bis-(O-geranylgeranyl)-sn-glycerol synthase [Candidatus Poseidoniia archaeon]
MTEVALAPLGLVLVTVWLMLPAYLANTIASIVGGGPPIDDGRNWNDGRRILGDGKTWRGLIGGTLGGLLVGHLQMTAGAGFFSGYVSWGSSPYLIFFLLACGALAGDMAASFIKRRRGQERGAKSPLLDVYDFIIGALLLTALFGGEWLWYWVDPFTIFILIIATPILHRSVNILGYKLGVKQVPW